MLKQKFYNLIELQFCGFRYHGWQKQKDVKTVQYMLERTLTFILEHENFKTLGSGRTDAMVSANHYLCELFISEEINPEDLLAKLNKSLPSDIRALKIKETTKDFNIIQGIDSKEYHYYFSCGDRPHPFCAPFISHFKNKLDIKKMMEAAQFFIGEHDFRKYCHRSKDELDYHRKILACFIEENTFFQSNYIPKDSYVLKISGKGFVRHQVRHIMGALVNLGEGLITENDIQLSLSTQTKGEAIGFIAPASGLHLHKVNF